MVFINVRVHVRVHVHVHVHVHAHLISDIHRKSGVNHFGCNLLYR